jgi:Protein of unknown function (DUF3039)
MLSGGGAELGPFGGEWLAPAPVEESEMASTETRPIESDADTGEDDGYAHYARKDEIARAAVLGGTVTALCGHRFQPVRDPSRFPVCPRCAELASLLDD